MEEETIRVDEYKEAREIAGGKKNLHSYSSLTQYLRCPRQYKFQRIDRVEVPRGGLFFPIGSAVHKGIEEYIINPDIDIDELIEISMNEFDHEVQWNDVPATDAEIDESKALVADLLREYHIFWEPHDCDPSGVEAGFMRKIRGKSWLFGKIDAVCNDGRIVDHKTSGRRWNYGKAVTEVQPDFYAWLLNRDVLFEHNVLVKSRYSRQQTVQGDKAEGKSPFAFERFLTPRTQRDRNKAFALMNSALDGIEAGYFPPTGVIGGNCGWCDYKDHCSKELGGIKDDEETANGDA
jgi:hypothetical protein